MPRRCGRRRGFAPKNGRLTAPLDRAQILLHLLRPGDGKDAVWDGWDAIGSYHAKEDVAVVFVFRTRGDARTRAIPMKALRLNVQYHVRYHDTGRTYVASGADILRDGFAMELDAYEDDPHSRCSEVIFVEPAR